MAVTLNLVRFRNSSPCSSLPLHRRASRLRDQPHTDRRAPLPEPIASTSRPVGPRRVQAVVALRLLEVMRDRDLPGELLEDEDPARTIPRRFGLSDVVDRQIRTYREDVRKRVKLTDAEVQDLLRFVIRRPDGPDVFQQVGRLLATGDGVRRGWHRLLPTGLRYRVARSSARKRLKKLFGRPVGGFASAPFVIEGRALMFIESDPGGDACHLLSGFCEQVLESTFGGTARVRHTLCQGRGDDLCRWEGEMVKPPVTVAPSAASKDDRDEEDAA